MQHSHSAEFHAHLQTSSYFFARAFRASQKISFSVYLPTRMKRYLALNICQVQNCFFFIEQQSSFSVAVLEQLLQLGLSSAPKGNNSLNFQINRGDMYILVHILFVKYYIHIVQCILRQCIYNSSYIIKISFSSNAVQLFRFPQVPILHMIMHQ